MMLMKESCETCDYDGFCFISVGIMKLFEGCEFIEIYNPETGEITEKGKKLFEVIGRNCDKHLPIIEDEE